MASVDKAGRFSTGHAALGQGDDLYISHYPAVEIDRSPANLRSSLKTGADVAAAAAVGKLLAERAKAAGVTDVVFDRGSFIYHGRVKAVAEAAREGGLNF